MGCSVSNFARMISVEGLSVSFGAVPLLEEATFVVGDGERLCIVGKNGAGKSTLLKMLAGLEQPTSGRVVRSADLRVGYLPQVLPGYRLEAVQGKTVRQEAEQAFREVGRVEAEYAAVDARLQVGGLEEEESLRLVERLEWLRERLSVMEADGREARLERCLTGLGFGREELDRPVRELSGGWRMRLELARLLLERPDVLLLDEPTNHLDIESITWLEQFVCRSKSALVLVSHDRRFLNATTSRTIEIANCRLVDYRVSYDEFRKLQAERRETEQRAYDNQQREIAHIEEFIEKFRYKPTKSNQVQSRVKQLEKMVRLRPPEVDGARLHLRFPPCKRSGDFPLICTDVGKVYGAHRVFGGVNLSLRRGEKVAFVGKNGEGKSTLVKAIMGEIEAEGEVKVGHNVTIGYYAQNEAQLLDPELTVYDTIDRAAVGEVRTKIRDLLGAFMFGGEASDKQVKVLSGGERSRLAMIALLLRPVNFLILDEPTNHLDMQTKEILKDALLGFDGTAIIVSHDRSFLSGLVDRVYVFGGGRVREHIGGIEDYLASLEAAEPPIQNSEFRIQNEERGVRGADIAQQRQQRNALKALQRRVEEAEKRVAQIEEERSKVEAQLATPEGAADAALSVRYAELSDELEKAMEEWVEAAEPPMVNDK